MKVSFTGAAYPSGMNLRRLSRTGDTAPDALLQRAGAALACAFSCSDEFEAAIVRSRRAAGVYGPKRTIRKLLCASLLAVAGLTGAAALVAALG